MTMPGYGLYNHINAQTQIQNPNTQIHNYKHKNTKVKYTYTKTRTMNIFAENTNPCGLIGMHREETTAALFRLGALQNIFMELNQPLMACAFSILN